MGRLDGKVAIVTGAGSGIGEASAHLMAREGGSVVVADISRTEAERVAAEIGGDAIVAEVDVSDEASVIRMVERLSSRSAALMCCTTTRPTPRPTPLTRTS